MKLSLGFPDPFYCRSDPIGRGVRLKSEMLWVRIPPSVLELILHFNLRVRLGSQRNLINSFRQISGFDPVRIRALVLLFAISEYQTLV